MKIAVDVMGGDFAPGEIIAGVLQAAENYSQDEMILVGNESVINQNYPSLPENVSIHHASDVMGMAETVENLRNKKESSIWVATKLVKENRADAVISAGSTAAQMASALLQFGRIKGIDRPAIATVYPTPKGGKILLDVGANANVRPEQLVQFALMGSTYAEVVLGMEAPRVALLSNGSEEGKGNETTVQAHQLLKKSGLNFIGNIEGRDIPAGEYDVAVTDGFTGNVLIKVSEGLGSTLFYLLKQELERSMRTKIGAALVLPGLKNLKKMLDYSEYGGAPLLGVKGVSIICHGSSKANAIKNAVRVARNCVSGRFIARIEDSIKKEGEVS